ncbi:hypothetical protein [Mycobacterium deserti]|uniref:DUF1579 domain-containing protein n=1 Tax=Mycobacterium deserti TaxID=2978347 RepID=A0ABT2M7R0_9MYCO|nr:hypothetical protein [Mycobacterium deserti]MCT7658289.1 hypothetical protein [Mycobacterium deserti]
MTYEPNPHSPDGGTSDGWEECRVGPGRSSVVFDTQAQGHLGTFEGHGVITWNATDDVYDLYWLSSSSPEPGVFTGRWDGGKVVFDGYEYIAGQRMASRHSITEISADAFVYTIDLGSAPADLTLSVTIDYMRRGR